jgi:hypothetical protein
MKKHLLTLLATIFFIQLATAQKARTVLENGIPLDKGDRIFLKYDTDKRVLKIDAARTEEDVDFITFEDSITNLFLVRKDAINVYLRPLNPLNYNYGTETNVRIDPINEEAANALGLIFDVLDERLQPPAFIFWQAERPKTCEKFYKDFNMRFKSIQSDLDDTKKEEIAGIFRDLKAVSFADEDMTISDLSSINNHIQTIETHFSGLESKINKSKELLLETDSFFDTCFYDSYAARYVYNAILKDFSLTVEEQKKRLTNLQAAYKLVKDMQVKASIGGGTDQLNWCIFVGELKAQTGYVSDFTIAIEEGGYELSEKNEIVSKESSVIITRSFSVRRYQKFVPEVSVGTAFTFFEYNTFGTTTDSSGQQVVAPPTKNMIQNLNISTMINFSYYIQNSPIHPFWQIGLGINSEIPTLLTGVGLRNSINGVKRFTISGGLAMSWLKELETLEVGDPVSGTGDIDNDFKYSSTPKFTFYLGIQYNF